MGWGGGTLPSPSTCSCSRLLAASSSGLLAATPCQHSQGKQKDNRHSVQQCRVGRYVNYLRDVLSRWSPSIIAAVFPRLHRAFAPHIGTGNSCIREPRIFSAFRFFFAQNIPQTLALSQCLAAAKLTCAMLLPPSFLPKMQRWQSGCPGAAGSRTSAAPAL